MSRAVHRLSAKTVESAKRPGYYCDGGGLYLQVSATLSKSWIFLYSRHGKSREMGLGSGRDVSLAEARAKAAEARRQLVDGVDPIEAREGRKAHERLQKSGTITFDECAHYRLNPLRSPVARFQAVSSERRCAGFCRSAFQADRSPTHKYRTAAFAGFCRNASRALDPVSFETA
jgi:Arm DNA-binding domain